MDIKIKGKIKAYTKGIIPTKTSQLYNDGETGEKPFIEEAPKDSQYYARKDGEWQSLEGELNKVNIKLPEGSGLNLDIEGKENLLSIRKEEGFEEDLPKELEEDTTYYTFSSPSLFISGGTAFSSGNNEFVLENEYKTITSGGTASTTSFIKIIPLNSKGVY